ncbi:MAG: hypothetical protein AAF399_27560 [Bacteroidota bacterium]
MRIYLFLLIVAIGICFPTCASIDLIEETGVSFETIPSAVPTPAENDWEELADAKEILNIRELLVFVDRGENPISSEDWENFSPTLPWAKNINRNLLFSKTFFYRSPGVAADCEFCEVIIDYKGYTWAKLATIVGLSFIPDETDASVPEPGHLVVQTIEKCQLVYWEAGETAYCLFDNHGNEYIMHATETGTPTTEVDLPDGWSIRTRVLDEPFILGPFGGGADCFFNIVKDHLGQGYHQYAFSGSVFPEN